MTYSSTTYYIEVKEENGATKIVPHTDKKLYRFIEGKKATDFLKLLKEKHPTKNFRKVKDTHSFKQEDWV